MTYTLEDYEKFANDFSMKHFNKPFDIEIKINNRLRNRAGSLILWFGNMTGMTEVNKEKCNERREKRQPLEMYIQFNQKKYSHDTILKVLQHEICHWYCYTEGLDYEDGTVDFERTLQETGSISTYYGFDDNETSNIIQTLTIHGVMSENSVNAKFKKVKNPIERIFENVDNLPQYQSKRKFQQYGNRIKCYEVYVKGQYIGLVYQDYLYKWCAINRHNRYEMFSSKTRKMRATLLFLDAIESGELNIKDFLEDKLVA